MKNAAMGEMSRPPVRERERGRERGREGGRERERETSLETWIGAGGRGGVGDTQPTDLFQPADLFQPTDLFPICFLLTDGGDDTAEEVQVDV